MDWIKSSLMLAYGTWCWSYRAAQALGPQARRGVRHVAYTPSGLE